MPQALTIEIAGIGFAVRCEDADLLPHEAAYRTFLERSHGGAEPFPVAVHVSPGVIPRGATQIFSNPAWKLFKDPARYYLSLGTNRSDSRSDYLAVFDHRVTSASIHCSGVFAQPRRGGAGINNPFCYPLDQILLMYALARRDGALIHASAVDFNGLGYIFAGRSGAGKSTISRLFASGGDCSVLSDDRVAVRSCETGCHVYGTPWSGTEGIALNERLPLHGIVFIRQGGENLITPLDAAGTLRRLLPVTSIPWYDEPVMTRALAICESLVSRVPACEMLFRPDAEAVTVFQEYAARRRCTP